MAAKFDVSALTLSQAEVTDIAKIIIEQAFVNSALAMEHEVLTGVAYDEQILFLDQMAIGGKALTGCTPAEIDGLVFSEKVWTPKLIAGRLTHCANDENQLFKILKKAQSVYPDFFDRQNSQEIKLLLALITTHIEESVRAKVWFSDTAAALIAGGGVFKAGTDVGIFNQFDGLFKQIFADATIPKVSITENAGLTYAAQKVASDDAVTYLESVYDNADSRLQSNPEAKFYLTPDIWTGLLKEIADKEANGGIVTTLTDGRKELTYMGIPVIRKNDWDRVIKTYQDNGTVYNIPNRIVLTTAGNIPVATLNEGDMQNLRSFYDQVTNSNYVDYGYYLDAKFGQSYMASVAY
jgi:hypothetical protein